MKKFLFVLMTIIVATLISCTKKVDPIHGIQPLNEAYSNKMPKEIISNLKQRGDVNGLFSFFDKRRKQITTNIVSQYPKVNDHQQIKLILGTGYADAILAGDGKICACTFSDELIILISDSAKTDTVLPEIYYNIVPEYPSCGVSYGQSKLPHPLKRPKEMPSPSVQQRCI
jgi:hypothetical protein